MINEIHNALISHPDDRIKNLTKREIDALTMSVLFSAHINKEMEGFEIQYLAPGLSGAGIVSVNPNIGLPFIIKYGKKDIIELEKNNYQKVISHIPHPILPVLREGSPLGNYNSVAYNWAGGRGRVENIRDFFNQASAEDMLRVISSLMNKLFEWYGIGTTTEKPMDQWKWSSKEIVDSIQYRIQNWDQDKVKKDKLLDILHNPQKWRDVLMNKKFSSGNCHGDLNYCNILVVQDGKNIFPVLIDFASICEKICPAKDWAKFEREIKFRFLRDVVPDNSFREALKKLGDCCDNLSLIESDVTLEKAQKMISLVRTKYSQKKTNISDTPHIEYLIFLFYTTLAYAVHEEIKEQPAIQNTVIDSAWQAAAAGFENREYPCGKWAKDRCNTSESHIGKTSPVGIFKNSDTPEGVSDMAGNVWEWTITNYDTREIQKDFTYYSDWESYRKNKQTLVLRGGSWFFNREDSRCADRYWYFPGI